MVETTRGGTAWRRCLTMLLCSALILVVMAALTIRGIMPLRMTIAGQELKVHAENAYAKDGLVAFPTLMTMKDGTNRPIVMAAIPDVVVHDDLCASLRLTFPLVGTFITRIVLTGDTHAKDVKAAINLADVGGLHIGDLSEPMLINKSADELHIDEPGAVGNLGIQAPPSNITIKSADATASGATLAGTVLISGMRLPKIWHGDGPRRECY